MKLSPREEELLHILKNFETYDVKTKTTKTVVEVKRTKPTITEIAAFLKLSRPNVYPLLDQMEAKGLIKQNKGKGEVKEDRIEVLTP